jgi:hypothetical protein
MKFGRFFHRLYAYLFGYFWLPCPICGQRFGGHEVKEIISVICHDNINRQICRDQLCAYKAGVRNCRGGVHIIGIEKHMGTR